MKVVIDQGRCVASGLCVVSAEKVFDQCDEDGLVVLLNSEPTADQADDVRRAAATCPGLAITVVE